MKPILSKKSTLASRQKLAAILIAFAILLLAVAYFVVDYIVHIDSFFDIDGTEYTIKRQGGVYALYDENGYMLETVVDDEQIYYLTELGTMVLVSDNGSAEVYAVVDTEDGEAVSAYNRLMIYPRIQTADVQSIDIKNKSGAYSFERNSENKIVLRGRETTAYDEELYAYLAAVCGNTTVVQKLSATALATYGFEEYGLDQPQATVTITTKSGRSETLEIGNPIVSNTGYYVRLKDRDAVYIFNNYIGSTVLVPLETYVTPALVYPLTANNYMFVYNFLVTSMTYDENGEVTIDPDISLTYWDYAERENTEYQTVPYKITDPNLDSYTVSSDSVYSVMNHFLEMKYVGIKKVGVTKEILEQYGLDKPVKSLYYEFEATEEDGTKYYLKNYVYFSALTENGTHYATSTVYASTDKKTYIPLPGFDQVVEIDRSYLPFIDWETLDWVERDYFQLNIGICHEMEFITDDYHILFRIKPVGDDVEIYLVDEKGVEKKLDTNNFKTLYLNMLGGKLFGSAKISEEKAQQIISNEKNHLLTWVLRTSASNLERTYSYYWLEESKCFLTVDGDGEFYVLTSAVEKTIQDAIDVANGVKITAVSPYTNIDK